MKTVLKAFLFILSVLALLLIVVLRTDLVMAEQAEMQAAASAEALAAEQAAAPSPEPADDTPAATPEPTPEPQPEYFTISCIGDCTLWSSAQFEKNQVGLPLTVGTNYAYPFSNTVQYFKDDEYTLANLECTLSDTQLTHSTQAMFYFLTPTSYINILKEGGVDFVTHANNHVMDFLDAGFQSSVAALQASAMPFGIEGQAQIVETQHGLKLGIYTAGNDMRPDLKTDEAVAAVQSLKEQGADYVICMFHWGSELYYTPNDNQTNLAHAVIDAGCDLVYGSHPHCLQPIEKYNDGLILYSLGNWVFGGSTRPSDPDTAIVQVTVKRDIDGTVTTDGFTSVPCCVSSNLDGAAAMADNYNNYCPTPYPEGSDAYNRVLAKLSGTYEAASQGADYSNFYASWG